MKTLHYNLDAFTGAYLSALDRKRFTTIDNQLSFLADEIGDGILSGWQLTVIDDNIIRITAGLGFVDSFATETYGNYTFELGNNARWYIYIKRKFDVVSDLSSFCSIASINYTDALPPATPATPTLESKSYNFIQITWVANSEPDISFYSLYKSTDGITWDEPIIVEDNTYLDEDINQNTTYFYKLTSTDANGLTNGIASGTLTVVSDFDSRIPSDPTNVEIINGNETLQILWDAGAFLVDSYRVTLSPIDTEGENEGDTITYDLLSTKFGLIITGLDNGQNYLATVKSVSVTGVESGGVSVKGQPVYTGGPMEIAELIFSDIAIDNSLNVAINLSWTLQEETYFPDPAYYLLTVQTGSEVSDPAIILTNSTILYLYTYNGIERTIKENTKYSIRIQSVDADGNRSEGYVVRIKTRKFSKPGQVTNFSIETEYTTTKKSVIATWKNTVTEFSYNTLTVTKRPIGSTDIQDIITIENNINIGQSESFSISKSDIENEFIYTFQIITFDFAGNQSEASGGAVALNVELANSFVPGLNELEGNRPPAPTGVKTISGNDYVIISWMPVNSDNINKYRIWRCVYGAGVLLVSDFGDDAIGEVPATVNRFVDYTVDNGVKYFYLVTSEDIFGQESPNPADNVVDHIYAIGEPKNNSDLSKPPVISVQKVGDNSVKLTWVGDSGYFDGYEIWRSIGNLYSWQKIDTTDSFASTYTDNDCLYLSGRYYYMIRKFRDDAEFVISRTEVSPIGAVFLGYATVIDNVTTVVNDGVDLNLLIDPIRVELAKQLSVPTHLYYNIGDDRRVRLSEILTVKDWTTTDFKNYITETDIRGTDNFITYIDNLQTGISSYVDIENSTLIFEEPIYDPVKNKDQPEPAITVVFLETSETENILPEENIGTIIANKITKGKVPQDALKQYDHLGRYKETCLPLQSVCNRINAYTYQSTTPAGVTFYDLYRLNNGQIVAGTSDGVRITDPLDITDWTVVLSSTLPVTKIFYSEQYEWYVALAGNEVWYSTDLENWTPIPGIDSSNIIRDITEDDAGYLYVSSDSGVYRLHPGQYVKLIWEQCAIVNQLNNSCYALAFNDEKIIVSCSDGLYETEDNGETWLKITINDIQVPVFHIYYYANSIFLISGSKIWRKNEHDSLFQTVATFSFAIRKMVIFSDSIYVTTDKGLYRSVGDVIESDNLKFVVAFPSLRRNNTMPCVFALKLFNNRMYLGMDERIYSSSVKRKLSLHADISSICPFIYLDNVERNVGVYYSQSNRILFDTALEPSAIVTIVSNYKEFKLINGGWADSKFDAEVTLFLNGVEQLVPAGTQTKPATSATYISQQTRQIITPSFNARTSNFNDALKYLTQIVQIVDSIDTAALLTPNADTDYILVAELYNAVNLFKVNLSPELAAIVTLPPIGGSVTTVTGISFDYDVVNGTVTINTGVSKYTSVAMSIDGVSITGIGALTHKEIDNSIEEFNSGLSASLASIQQSNIIKIGIQNQKLNPGLLDINGGTYQARYYAPCDNWYDTFNSTVDYNLELEQQPVFNLSTKEYSSFSINYPSDVIHIEDENEVWVCGAGGIIAVNTSTLECEVVLNSEFYFYNMHLDQGVVYALAEDGLYQITTSDKSIYKDVNLELPSNYTSVLHFGNTTYIATVDGLYSRRTHELQWTKLFNVNNSFVRSGQKLTFCIGTDPLDKDTSIVFYSHSGVIWNRSTQLVDFAVSGATQRGDSVYYATGNGLIIEDLSTLFSQVNNGLPTISIVDLDGDDIPDDVVINSVDADADSVFAATADGLWYKLSGNYIVDSGESRLNTIHKIKVVNGEYWLFADNLIDIQSSDKIIQLTTGKMLI